MLLPWLLELSLTQTKVTPEEETSIKKLPPLAWSSEGHVLIAGQCGRTPPIVGGTITGMWA